MGASLQTPTGALLWSSLGNSSSPNFLVMPPNHALWSVYLTGR